MPHTTLHAGALQDPAIPLSDQHYRGVYMLLEKVSRGKDRVDVKKYDPEVDPSGATALLLVPAAEPFNQPVMAI